MLDISIKRIYEPAGVSDGTRILVDRLWPRGISKEHAGIDMWLKDIAPTTALRRWFAHDPGKWEKFRQKYRDELKNKRGMLEVILGKARAGKVTLVYSARDTKHNDAVVLREMLREER